MFSSNSKSSHLPTIKLLLIGDSGVGKSSLLLRFVSDTFDPDINSTIGVDFYVKDINVASPFTANSSDCHSHQFVRAQIWDTAGQERFRTLTHSYYRGASAIILVYDVNEKSSFTNLGKWIEEAKAFLSNGEEPLYMLLGNKTDLVLSAEGRGDMPVPLEQAQAFARQHKMQFVLCSAKTKQGVVHAFEEAARRVHDRMSRHGPADSCQGPKAGSPIHLRADEMKEKIACC